MVSCNDATQNDNTDDFTLLYLDKNLDAQKRIQDLMSRMTLEEKVGQMCQYVGLEHMKRAEKRISASELKTSDALGFYPGLKIEDIAKMTTEGKIGSFLHVVNAKEANHLQSLAQKSRLKIPLLIGIDAIHGNGLVKGSTIYPSPISQAATWDDALIMKGSSQTALEQRATGSHWSFTPNIDVLRDPRWGRTGETFGEDPYLVGKMGVATVKGLQSNDFSGYSNVIACAKHLIAGSQSINGLNAAPTDISKRTLYEIFLPPYKKAIQDANVFSVMAAHNEVNGIPAHMNKNMMTNILRDRWGFNGFFVSDWNDVDRISKWHFVAKDFKEASLLSVNAGLDMHMHGPEFYDYVLELVNEGSLSEERVDYACSKILEAKFKLGLFENPFVDIEKIDDVVFNEEHQKTALEQSRKVITLLKNNDVLPLNIKDVKSIFVVGPNSNNETILGDWVKPQPEDNIITILEGIDKIGKQKGFTISHLDIGYNSRKINNQDILKAANKAQNADLTVLVLGENSFRHDHSNKTTGENVDRASLKLSGKQLELASKIIEKGKPVVLIYISGSPIAEPELEDQVNAVINAWEPGAFGGQAVAEVLFGDINPSGKLPLTIPRSVGQLQMVYNYKPTAYVHRYHTEKKTPLHPFGFGLSYTTFEFSDPEVSKTEIKTEEDIITVSTTVSNTGLVAGEEVVQLYIRDKYSSFTRPVKELKGYKRVFLNPNETKQVEIELTTENLAMYDSDYNYVVEPGEFIIMTGNSSDDKNLKKISLNVAELMILEKAN